MKELESWISRIRSIHCKEMDLTLERVRLVWQTIPKDRLENAVVIVVGGTNGKGSCVAFLESVLLNAGYSTGSFTSPHFFSYAECIRVRGSTVNEADLVRAFEAIECYRKGIPLTVFEFLTLAALVIFMERKSNTIILEVGLGGVTDAVNIVDADIALITNISLDHQGVLGNDLESIAKAKVGVLRKNRTAVIGQLNAPPVLLEQAEKTGAKVLVAGKEYRWISGPKAWDWICGSVRHIELPYPSMKGIRQIENASAVLMVLEMLKDVLSVPESAIRFGIKNASLEGRFQIIIDNKMLILDVAHNAAAAKSLAIDLKRVKVKGVTHGVFACYRDKDVKGILHELCGEIDFWNLAPTEGMRGLSIRNLKKVFRSAGIDAPFRSHPSIASAFEFADVHAKENDRIVITGSFFSVAEVLKIIRRRG